MSALQHIPLDRSTRQIRLLSFLEIDAATLLIRCRLDTYNLNQCPQFVALSYTWGDLHPSRAILLNGEVFPVGQNLYSALSVLVEDTPRDRAYWRELYWIDAICINQHDDSERSHQVNMMGIIYSQASFVLVWLGPGNVHSNRSLEEAASYHPILGPYPGSEMNLRREIRRVFRWEIRRKIRESGIAANAYWKRMWVIQEFTLAKDIFLLQGRSKVSWEVLRVLRVDVGNFGAMDAMDRLVDGRRRWKRKSATSETTLDLLICMFESSKCSDVRDRVYALLSLVGTRSDDSKPLYADYTISPWQLYYRVLSNVRQSPSLRNAADWDTFRARLCNILVISRDEDFERNDFLYRVSEIERPDQKPLMSLSPDYRIRLGHAFLIKVTNYLHWPLAVMDRDPQLIYEYIIQILHPFPKEEDPEAWNCFDKLLQEALGLWFITSEHSKMKNMYIHFPKSTVVTGIRASLASSIHEIGTFEAIEVT